MSIHARVRAKIEAGVPCHAQAVIEGQTISWHPGLLGWGMAYSGNLVVRRPLQGRDLHRRGYVRSVMIDLWVKGEALVSPRTFTRAQLDQRAREHEHGNGPAILPGARDPAFAARIREFAVERADELADEGCP